MGVCAWAPKALRKAAASGTSIVTPTSTTSSGRREISRPSSAAAATPSPRSSVDRPSPRTPSRRMTLSRLLWLLHLIILLFLLYWCNKSTSSGSTRIRST
ncbi:hypothetical protein V2J09_006340 [Rumex salicifolius]